jgi:hypothetical protein
MRFSHIINPINGMGITQQKRILTVIAYNGALADWLATACSLDNKAALKLAKKCRCRTVDYPTHRRENLRFLTFVQLRIAKPSGQGFSQSSFFLCLMMYLRCLTSSLCIV